MKCAFCDSPLVCDRCGAEYEPNTPEEYEAIQSREQLVFCRHCEQPLACVWCKTAYEPVADDVEDVPD